ncbi:alpha/beta fold hydrolase [Streptomyces sp. NPDC058374]|uniref:alpha/beta fold hydrolase n=1 Tax=Streptomyces sp. NPDC058374 TaxID=3346466 RepID=UPI00365CA451
MTGASGGTGGPLPLVVVPGMLCDESLWSEVALPAGHEVRHLTLDRPEIGALAEKALALVDGPFVLVGLSLGAIVGFEAVRRAPERVAGLCVMATNAGAPRPEQYAAWRAMDALIDDGRFAEVVEQTLPGMFDRPAPPAAQAQRYRRMARAVGPEAARAQLAAQATRTDALDALRLARCPAAVLHGTRDALCPPEFHAALADALPDARLHTLPGAGHLLPWERPEAVSAVVRGVVAAAESARSAPRAPVPASSP